MADDASEFVKNISAIHNADELPLILGNTKQAKEYLTRVGEWDTNEKAEQQGMYNDDFWAWMSTGMGYNPKEVSEDGSFVDIFSMKSPTAVLYPLFPLIYLYDGIMKARKSPGPSDDLKDYIKELDENISKAFARTPAERAGPQVGGRPLEEVLQGYFTRQEFNDYATVQSVLELTQDQAIGDLTNKGDNAATA